MIGCSEQLVKNAEEALVWLGVGNAARITGVTQMNKRSSRSHAVFTIHISKCACMYVCACIIHVHACFMYIQSREVGVWPTSSLMRELSMEFVCLASSTLWTWLDPKEPLVLETEGRGSKVSI